MCPGWRVNPGEAGGEQAIPKGGLAPPAQSSLSFIPVFSFGFLGSCRFCFVLFFVFPCVLIGLELES